MSPKKRCIIAKKQQINKAAATIQNDPRHLRTSDGDSNSPTTEVPNVPDVQVENDQLSTKPKRKGKAKVSCFTKGKGKGTRLEVEFNEMGQPFRANAAKLSSFLGITARELIPVTLDKWSDLTDDFMTQIWDHIMVVFFVSIFIHLV